MNFFIQEIINTWAQSAGTVEYTNPISAER